VGDVLENRAHVTPLALDARELFRHHDVVLARLGAGLRNSATSRIVTPRAGVSSTARGGWTTSQPWRCA
jgi:hypothetical protein